MEKYLILGKELTLPAGFSKEIEEHFKPLSLRFDDLKDEFESIKDLEIKEENLVIFKELRLRFAKVRTTTAKEHKAQKSKVLQIGKAYDSVKNLITENVVEYETQLKDRELFFEKLEQTRINTLEDKRLNEVRAFGVDGFNMNLGTIDDKVYAIMLKGFKADYEAEKERKKQEVLDRVLQEAREEEERKAFEKEQAKLKEEQSRIEKEKELLRIEQARIEAVKQEEQSRIEEEKRQAREKAELPEKEKLLDYFNQFSTVNIALESEKYKAIKSRFDAKIQSIVEDFKRIL